MNATEQHTHRTVTQELNYRISALEPIVVAIDERVTQAYAEFDRRLRDEFLLLNEQRHHSDTADHDLRSDCADRWAMTTETHMMLFRRLKCFELMTFWQRFRWLLTGWVPWPGSVPPS